MAITRVFATAFTLLASIPLAAQWSDPAPPTALSGQASSKPAIGSFGFDTTGMDPAIRPGDDFYAYANGKWSEATTIPPGRSNHGTFSILGDLSKRRVEAILDKAATDPDSKIGRAYRAYLDVATIEEKRLAPIDPWLDRIRALDKAGLPALLADADRNGIRHFFEGFGWPDDDRPDRYIYYMMQGGLGMPEREHYLSDGRQAAALRADYIGHLETMLRLIGEVDAHARAEAVYAFEKRLAAVHWSRDDSNDQAKTNNRLTIAELGRRAPDFDWPTYFRILGVRGDHVIVAQPDAISGEAKLIAEAPVAVLRDLLFVRSVDRFAAVMPKAFADEAARYSRVAPPGSGDQRRVAAAQAVTDMLPDAVSRDYIALHYPPETAAEVDRLAAGIREAAGRRIATLGWMQPETKAKALRKLAAMRFKIGHPIRWTDYDRLEIRADDAFGNALRASQFAHDDEIARLAGPFRDWEWGLNPTEINGYANYARNEVVITAAILQPPFFDRNADPAVNFGGIGAAIAAQVSRHFDDFGAGYDEEGRAVDWWTERDFAAFREASEPLVAQYDAYEVLPGRHVDGRFTLGENMADLAGLIIAYDAYKASLNGKEAPVIDGLTGDQRFFLGWAQVWRRNYREQNLSQRITTDPHSPSIQRTWVSRNLDPWYKAYQVQEGQKLYLKPEDRVRIW